MRPLTRAAVSEEELADLLAISHEQLKELRRRHHLPHLRINRYTIRYMPEHVAEVVARFEIRENPTTTNAGLSAAAITRRRRRRGRAA